MPVSAAVLEEYVHHHARHVSAGGEAPGELKAAIPLIKDYADKVLNDTNFSHDIDQDEIDDTLRLIAECSPDVEALMQDADDKRTEHTNCRKVEVTEADNDTSLCNAYHGHR